MVSGYADPVGSSMSRPGTVCLALRRVAWVALLLCVVSVGASAEPGRSLRIPRVHRPPKLQEFIDGTPREAEIAVTEFWQLDPVNGQPVSQPTVAYLSYDERNLYVGWVCKDDLARIRARVARREDVMNDDRITINIDPFHDRKHSYWFDVNPYGVQSDGMTTDGQGDDVSWDAVWYSEGRLAKDGYVVLETIPFRSLRFRAGDTQDWGFTLCRLITRNNETSCSPHISRERMPQWVGQFGTLEIPENISPGRNIQFTPYGMFSGSRYLDSARGYQTSSDQRVGLDTKMVLKDAFTLDLTANPDFSQVESDEPQVTVNQRYEVVYSERRPFFTENASLFKLPEQLFFSRRIIDPQFGAKLTGTRGRWSLGLLVADDRAPGQRLDSGDPDHGSRALNEVVRVERAFHRQSHMGVTFVNTDFGSTWNRVGSLDTRVGFGGNWFGKLQLAHSSTRSADGRRLNGQDVLAGITNSTTHTSFSSTWTGRSPGFRAELGYIPRVDIREWKNNGNYRWRPKNSSVVAFGPGMSQGVNWDRQGRVQEWWVTPSFTVEMLRLTNFSVEHKQSYELFQNLGFRQHTSKLHVSSEPSKRLALHGNYQFGRGVNYYPGSGLLPFAVHTTNADGGLTWRPAARMKLDESYIYTRLGAEGAWVPGNASAGSSTILVNHILRTRMNYQFTRALALRTIIDYNGVLPNTSLISLEKSKRIGVDVLLSYLLHPGTAFYVGYSDAYENVNFDALHNPAFRRTQFPGTNTGRQVFAKLSYLLRY